MKTLRASLAAIFVLGYLCLSGAAEAGVRAAWPASRIVVATWHSAVPAHHVRHWARRHVHHRRHFTRSVASRHAITVATHAGARRAQLPFSAPNIVDSAVGSVWGGGSDVVAEAARYVGSGKFTSLPGAWCADAVNAWLTASGHRPLPGRSAYSALAYGPQTANPREGDLIVMRGHVGVFEGWDRGRVRMISGNWSHHVTEATVSPRAVVAFVSVEGTGAMQAPWRYAGPPHKRCRVCYVHRRVRWT